MQSQTDKVTQEYQIKKQECLQNLLQNVDDSYHTIDAKLDQLLNYTFNASNKQPLQQYSFSIPGNLVSIEKKQFPLEISQESTSLIKQYIQKEVQQKEQYYKKELKENEIKWEQKIEEKNYEILQLRNNLNCQRIQSNNLTEQNSKPFIYELIPEISIDQNEECCAVAVNKDFTTLIGGCNSKIKVFEHNQGGLKQVQILNEHEKRVNILNFMKRSYQFISGSEDQTIIIWVQQKNNSWICQQKLNGHTQGIFCLVLNTNEDVIVSGSSDKQIKFWLKKNEWMHTQTVSGHTRRILGLSLNEQQNRVISCGDDNLILVIEQSEQNQQWFVKQKITTEAQGLRICFIDKITFTFYPWGEKSIYVFELNSTNQQYIKVKQITVEGGSDWSLFPQQYNKLKAILVNKNSNNVSLIKRNKDGEFIIQQSIKFETYKIFGCLTDDGQYFITWDKKSKQYQIRRYQEK